MPETRTLTSSADAVNTAPDTAKPALSKKQRRTYRLWGLVRKVAATFPLLWPEVKSGQFRPLKSGQFRPLKTGISADVSAWIAANPQAGLSEEEWKQAVRFVVSRLAYLNSLTTGNARVDLNGEPAGTVTESEEQHARQTIAAIRARFVKKSPPEAK